VIATVPNTPDLLAIFNRSWAWTGRRCNAITAVSPFGHLILSDEGGRFLYCDPEQLTLADIADSDEALWRYMAQAETRETWESTDFVEQARARLGEPGPGRVYHWITAPVLGGAYAPDNMATIALAELIDYAGDLAEQIKDLPDGAKVQLKVVE
jgi:hypothetical protein